jgi:hypothetical protein
VAVPTALVWLVARRSRDRWTPAAVAALIESRVGALDNLVVTAVELDRWPERASRTMREEVERQAASRAALVSSSAVVPMRGASAVCGIVCASAAGVLWSALASSPPAPDGIRHATGPPAIERVAVGVSPPAYLRRPVTTVEGAGPVAVPAGSLVRLEVVSRQPRVWVEDPASGTTALASRGRPLRDGVDGHDLPQPGGVGGGRIRRGGRLAPAARDPSGAPVESDAFTIEIGRSDEIAGAGVALPAEDRRYAISQQMVIVKTDRLHRERSSLSADEVTERSRQLAADQRMVRAEVVFLSGGEVEDEVVEAERAHELQEGRLENPGRAEMLIAIAAMSRAEARLIAGDTSGALVFERAALGALQKAFDRRRYFLRTLPERARIDSRRRLTGDRSGARSSSRGDGVGRVADALAAERAAMLALASLAEEGTGNAAAVAARLASLDSGSAEWRALATGLAGAATPASRREAARAAMAALAVRARRSLAPVMVRPPGEPDAVQGWWAQELGSGGSRR